MFIKNIKFYILIILLVFVLSLVFAPMIGFPLINHINAKVGDGIIILIVGDKSDDYFSEWYEGNTVILWVKMKDEHPHRPVKISQEKFNELGLKKDDIIRIKSSVVWGRGVFVDNEVEVE